LSLKHGADTTTQLGHTHHFDTNRLHQRFYNGLLRNTNQLCHPKGGWRQTQL